MMFSNKLRLTVLGGLGLWLSTAALAATITVINNDIPGIGFNDATPVAPIGGNTGTSLGQQRLIAYQAAADKWGRTLVSKVPIRIQATWEKLTCTTTGAVLGSAGASSAYLNFPHAPVSGHWYGKALANKLSGSELDSTRTDIIARFNVNLGGTGCLDGVFFYLGLDNNHGTNVDFMTVLLHELGHGLGFQTLTSGSTGAQLGSTPTSSGFPSVWDDYLLDTTTGKTWTSMTDAERAASALNARKLVWTGSNAKIAAAKLLSSGSPTLTVTSPVLIAGEYLVGTASFGAALNSPGVSGSVVQVHDLACTTTAPLSPISVPVSGKIALIDRGICLFTEKVKGAQNLGAIGVIIADTVAGSPPSGLGGTDATITIPAVKISLADANALKLSLAFLPLAANMRIIPAMHTGADASGRPLMYTPNPYQGGSSVSHWDTSMSPNQLMEPSINADLQHAVKPPLDMTTPLLKDIGWTTTTDLTPVLMLLLD
jgi:hypothetical protein